MPINDFKPFAAGPGANVTSQADWENLPALLSGFMSGKASSAQINKAFRQVSFIAAALAQFVSEKTDQDVLDDGDLPGFVEKLTAGFAAQYLSRSNPFGDIASDGPAAIATALSNLQLGEAAKRDVGTDDNQIPDMSAWASGDGWRRTPDGYIEQWGTLLQDSNVTQTLLFPIPFLHKVENICLTETTQSTSTSNVSAWGFNKDTLTLSSVTVINSKTNTGEWLYWRAIGK